MTESEDQQTNSVPHQLKPWQFKPGVSGNPGGRPKGSISLKEYAKRMLFSMSDKEKAKFMEGIDKDKVWEMAEGRAKQDVDVNAEVTTKIVSIDE